MFLIDGGWRPLDAPNQPERDLTVRPLSESRVFVKKLILKRAATTGLALTITSFLGLMVAVPAATGMSATQKPSTSVLVPVSAAKAAGFTKQVTAPTTSTDTSVSGCPDGAQEEYANVAGTSGLLSEVLYRATAADAAELLQGIAAE